MFPSSQGFGFDSTPLTRKVFEAFDGDNSGKISLIEVPKSLPDSPLGGVVQALRASMRLSAVNEAVSVPSSPKPRGWLGQFIAGLRNWKYFTYDEKMKFTYKIYDRKPSRSGSPDRALRIAVLSRENNYSTRRIVEEGEARGHTVEVIDTTRCYMAINASKPEVHYDGARLPRFDAVIPRIGASITPYGTAVVRQFETIGTFCLPRDWFVRPGPV